MRLLRLNNGQSSDITNGEFECIFNEDVKLEPKSKIALYSASIPIDNSNERLITDGNNQISCSTDNGQTYTAITLTNGVYPTINSLTNMLTNVISSALNTTGTMLTCVPNSNKILMKKTFSPLANSNLNYTLGIAQSQTYAGYYTTSPPNVEVSIGNAFAFQSQPIQACNSLVCCQVGILPSQGGNENTQFLASFWLGISNIPISNTAPVSFTKYMGISKPGSYTYITINGNNYTVPNLEGLQKYVTVGDILSIEFASNEISYCIYRPVLVEGQQPVQYNKYVILSEPWISNYPVNKYYVGISMARTSKNMYCSVPLVMNDPNINLVNGQYIDTYYQTDENPVFLDTTLNTSQQSFTYLQSDLEEVYDDSGNLIQYPDLDPSIAVPPPSAQGIADTGFFKLLIPTVSLALLLGLILPTSLVAPPPFYIQMNGQNPTYNFDNKYGYTDAAPKALIIEMVSINTLQSFDSTVNRRRNVVAMIPRTELQNNLLIYQPYQPVFIDINNAFQQNMRSFRIRMTDLSNITVKLTEVCDLVFLIE